MNYEKFKEVWEDASKDYVPCEDPIITDNCSKEVLELLDKVAEISENGGDLGEVLNLPPAQDFTDLGRGALDNLYMCRQCYTDEEKFNLLVEIILKIKGSLYTTNQTLKFIVTSLVSAIYTSSVWYMATIFPIIKDKPAGWDLLFGYSSMIISVFGSIFLILAALNWIIMNWDSE